MRIAIGYTTVETIEIDVDDEILEDGDVTALVEEAREQLRYNGADPMDMEYIENVDTNELLWENENY